jgi:pimeloyl-ACP methyl ester carboxylesterase
VLERELHAGSGEQLAAVGGLELCYETFGSPADPPLLLIMGLGAQMILWDEDFCAELTQRGFFVIRFDNRDVGRSTILRDAPVPSRTQLILRDRRGAPYSLDDMAGDASGLIDRLRLGPVHVVGVSMGGMIAQLLTINYPRRVRSLVSIMSTTGSRRVGQAHPRLWARMLRRPRRGREAYIEDFIATYRAIGSPDYPTDPEVLQARAARCFDRGLHAAGTARQLAAVLTAADRTPLLAEVRVPTSVIHGGSDQLVMPSGGKATAKAVPGARLTILPGMGHDLPRPLWPEVIDAITENAAAANA